MEHLREVLPFKETCGALRCFIAIEMPHEVKSGLSMLQEELKKYEADVRWVEPNNIHLTFKFLGNVAEKEVSGIINVMREICKKHQPFNLRIAGVGIFPNTQSPRVIWAGVEYNTTLEGLNTHIENEMMKIGFQREERRFTPHLTLGRFRSPTIRENLSEIIKSHKDDNFGITPVRSISLMRSELSPSGPRYSRIAEVFLSS